MKEGRFYIVNQSNQFGYIVNEDKREELCFTPYRVNAKVFESDNELDDITNISEFISKGLIQKRYVTEEGDYDIKYDELDLFIVMAFSENRYEDRETRYYYKNFDKNDYGDIDCSGNFYVNDISKIDFKKCTCILEKAENIKSNIHFSLNSKILKYAKINGQMCWINIENGLPIKYDIIIDLFNIIGDRLNLNSETYDGKMYGMMTNAIANIFDKENV